jgi:hypothetical protein
MKQESGVLKIMGEEDLLGLPLIHSLPLGSVMFYGQPGMGVVMIEVNEETKGKFARFIKSSF